MITEALAVASVPLFITCVVLWRCYSDMLYRWKQECRAHGQTLQDETVRNNLLERTLYSRMPKPLPAPQQTRIFGNAKTEQLIAEWLEKGWSPLGDDLTDTENSLQIAQRIRRGEYLNELVSTKRRNLRGDAG